MSAPIVEIRAGKVVCPACRSAVSVKKTSKLYDGLAVDVKCTICKFTNQVAVFTDVNNNLFVFWNVDPEESKA